MCISLERNDHIYNNLILPVVVYVCKLYVLVHFILSVLHLGIFQTTGL